MGVCRDYRLYVGAILGHWKIKWRLLKWDYIGIIGSILDLYWDIGKQNGNYYSILGLYRDNLIVSASGAPHGPTSYTVARHDKIAPEQAKSTQLYLTYYYSRYANYYSH